MQCNIILTGRQSSSVPVVMALSARSALKEAKTGKYYCFECAMLHSVSEGGTSIKDKREKGEKKRREKKKWAPFHYFVVVSCVLILVMWGVIIFGGEKAPPRTIDFAWRRTSERQF